MYNKTSFFPGLQGILGAMGGCAETRGEAFRLFVADLFFTTDQVGRYMGEKRFFLFFIPSRLGLYSLIAADLFVLFTQAMTPRVECL